MCWLVHFDHQLYIKTLQRQRLCRQTLADLEMISKDSDWTVRYEVALRAKPDLLRQMLDDAEEEVRLAARQRWTALVA